jgi:protein-disulfide isomerase
MFLKEPINQNDHYMGNLNASTSIVLYGDYECSICAKDMKWINQLVREYKDSILFVFRHYPLTYIHPHSAIAAVAAEAASAYGKFWQMHSKLYEHYSILSGESILNMAQQIGLNRDIFMHDLEKNEYMDSIISNIMTAEESGVESSPTYFLNGTKLFGIVNYESLKNDIEHWRRESQAHL